MDVSPYLAAIQSFKGKIPREKFKELHSIARKIIASDEERDNFVKNGITDRLPPALHPTLRILVDLKLKSKDAVVEALKSDDASIVKLTFGANWFFNISNDLVNVDYFKEKLFPFISLRTRRKLIKALSKCLPVEQAENFHRHFALLLGSDQALPLLFACRQDYVYDEILKNKIIISEKILFGLYCKYPQLAIRYLYLIKNGTAKRWNIKGKMNRRKYRSEDKPKVEISDYLRFLPSLVKKHTQEFIDFYRSLSPFQTMKLSSTRAKFFLKSAADILAENPNKFLEILPLNIVKKKLSKDGYETMLQNLFPKDINDFESSEMNDYIKKYYPDQGGFELFREHYKKAYGKDLLERVNFLVYDSIYKVLPSEIKAEWVRRSLSESKDKKMYWKRVYRLPPQQAIPLLKEQINKSSVLSREECLCFMLESCDLHDSKESLLEVLQYYNSRHKNEQASVFIPWLNCLSRLFGDMQHLDREHWQIIKEIVLRADVNGDILADVNYSTNSRFGLDVQRPLQSILRCFLKKCKTKVAEEDDNVFLDKIINIILEYYCERDRGCDFLINEPEIEDVCLTKFLTTIPQKYPKTHAVWDKNNMKWKWTWLFIEKMGQFNKKHSCGPLDQTTKFMVQHYPWLEMLVIELFAGKEENYYSRELKKHLPRYFPEFYQSLIDENSEMTNDVTTNDALTVLKRDPGKILSKIDAYATNCRLNLAKGKKSTRRFVSSLKWYQDIPVKFVENCLTNLEEKGSILVLGLLLEGQILNKIIEPYLPNDTKLNIDGENAKKRYEFILSLPRALNYTNPPPPLEALVPLCKGDYLSVALSCLNGTAQRVPIDKVLHVANQLTNDISISMKKAGIRLIYTVSPKPEACEFLKKLYNEKNDPPIREIVAKMVYKVFTQSPNEESWQLLKKIIQDLLPDDNNIFDILMNFSSVNADYATDYIMEIFKKINCFSDEDLKKMEEQSLIQSFLEEIVDDREAFNKLPEPMITEIISDYLFECPVDLIYKAYLFYDKQKFEGRLEVIMRTLSENFMLMTKPDPKQPRRYSTMKKIHEKFADPNVFTYLNINEKKCMSQRFVASILRNNLVRKDLDFFISFNIYRIFINGSDAHSIGKKCGENIDSLLKIYNNELIIGQYGGWLGTVLGNSSFKNNQFDVIDGLNSHKARYGVLVGLKMLPRWARIYDERLDQFVESAQESDDIMIQAALNMYLLDRIDYD